MKGYLIYLLFLLVMSVIAFCLYGADKQKAKNNRWRTKEATLLGVGFFGGAVGALLGMKVFRHKTKHWYFWVVNILGMLCQAALLFLILKIK